MEKVAASPSGTPYALAGKRVWVAGHRGMVGAALVRRLARESCQVLTVDRRSVDLTRQEAVERWMAEARPQAVFVAAAKVGGILANDSFPAEFLYENLAIEANIIHAAWKTGVEKLLFLPPEQLNSTGFLFNGSFEVTPSGLPFDWVVNEGAGVTVDIVERPDRRDGQRALLVQFGLGRVDFRGVQQLVMLAPGTYEFTGQYKGEIVGKRGLVWRVSCAGAPKLIGESAMAWGASPKWKAIEFTFTVPETDCRAQQVRLELDARMASEQLVSGSIWYDELRIGRAFKGDTPENGRARP